MIRKHIAQGVGAVALIAIGVVAGVAWTSVPAVVGRPVAVGFRQGRRRCRQSRSREE